MKQTVRSAKMNDGRFHIMSRQVICRYCGASILTLNRFCPNCGAANPEYTPPSTGPIIPETIAQLQEYCEIHRLPLKDIHFHIGENYTKPKAIGIFQSGDSFTVYKNMADGTRLIRYQGNDEAYAVKEVYLKLQEVLHRFENQ